MNQKIANGQILQGNVLDKIKEIPDEIVDLTIFSPPYWALRNYSVEGQWGLEPNFQDFLAKMDSLMDEIRRVTKKTGTVFVNFGDTYAGGLSHSGWESVDNRFKSQKMDKERFYAHAKVGVQKKSLYGIPERFYINCIDKGWIARNFIPWIKENAMPQSVPDRFTNKWERIFFFAKEGKYFFNLDAVREKPKYEPKNGKIRSPEKQSTLFPVENEDVSSTRKQDNTLRPEGIDRSKLNFNERWQQTLEDRFAGDDPGNKSRVKAAMNMMQGSNENGKNPGDVFSDDRYKSHYDESGFCLGCGEHFSKHAINKRAIGAIGEHQKRTSDYTWCNPLGANPGDVFRINPTPLPEAHFATFPLNLPLKIIKCACPPDGIVFDPFMGAGTVALAAEILARDWIGIELKTEYIDIIKKRLEPHNNLRL